MSHVAIIGCGIVGAAIAYELSQVPGLNITVLDKHPPAQGSTSAALGVLMGAISHKIKGRAWQMRQISIQRYEALIPELEALTGRKIRFNRQGILMLCFEGEDMAGWHKLADIRHSQGWPLEIWDVAKLQKACPQLDCTRIVAAVYSPQDRQVEPVALTLALVDAAQHKGVAFQFGVSVSEASRVGNSYQIQTTSGSINADWLILTAGLGTSQLTASLEQPIEIRPVLGQALQLQLSQPLGDPEFQPVITGNDVHIVPVAERDYWIGATVEFPTDTGNIPIEPSRLDEVLQQAIAFCPLLAQGTVIRTWSGLRPRPEGRPAPVIGPLPGHANVLLATGHYRNGVLLAPATAQAIREAIVG